MTDMTYDPSADAAYIYLGRAEIAESEEVAPGFVLDYDAGGRVVGIEIIGASKVLAPGEWSQARRPGAGHHEAAE